MSAGDAMHLRVRFTMAMRFWMLAGRACIALGWVHGMELCAARISAAVPGCIRGPQ